MYTSILVFLFILLIVDAYFLCPKRCQCYENPDGSSQIVHLICKWDELNSTNFRSLRHAERVRTLTIRCPHFSKKKSTPPPGLFQDFRNLDRLEIDRCVLTSLPTALLSGLTKLYSLIIKNAKLPSIPDELLRYTPNLMTLDLSGNALRIEPYTLRSLQKLTHLDMSNNSVSFITNTLVSLTSLNVLALDNNKLTNIDFRRLPERLTDLSLRNNYITTIHYAPESARSLHRIDLAGNQLDFIVGSGSVNMLPPSLKQVDLSRNRITFIQEGALGHMKELALLDLKSNLLTELKESSVSGPQNQLRMFLEGNPFQCHCGLRWLFHVKTKAAPVVLDLPTLTCTPLLDDSQVLNLTVADRTNQLTCRYETLCPSSCTCCEEPTCTCRSTCPTQCLCYRSANIERRNAQNILDCKKLRLDLLDIPESVTELRIDAAKWKLLDIEKFQKIRHLTTLRISNTSISDGELGLLASIGSLKRVQLSSVTLSRIPPQFGRLTHLQLAGNSLNQLTADDIKVLNTVKRVSLGGNTSSFSCDCETPTPLQLWLREKRNRDKVEDIEKVTCFVPSFGKVPVISTLPSNDSICQKETVGTTQWIKMITNIEKRRNSTQDEKNKDGSDYFSSTEHGISIYSTQKTGSTISSELGSFTSTEEDLYTEYEDDQSGMTVSSNSTSRLTSVSPKEVALSTDSATMRLRTVTVVTSTVQSTTIPPFTTPRQRRKYSRDHHPDEFLNALVFILFVCVLILVVTIAFTLYYRFVRTDGGSKHHKHLPEAAPLNGEATATTTNGVHI